MGKLFVKKEYIYAIAAVMAWGTAAPVCKAVMENLSEEYLLFTSSALSFVILLVLNLINHKNIRKKGYREKEILTMALLGALGLTVYTFLYYAGIARLPAAEACTVNYLWPMMIVIFSIPILKEKLTLKKAAGILASFLGIVLIATQGQFKNLDHLDFSGVFFCLGAAVCYGLFCVLLKKYEYDEMLLLCIGYFVTMVISGILCFQRGAFGAIKPLEGMGILWNGAAVSAAAYLLWAKGLNLGDTAKISNIAYFTPFLSVVFGKIILNESVTGWSLAGLIFIVSGVLFQIIRVQHRLPEKPLGGSGVR